MSHHTETEFLPGSHLFLFILFIYFLRERVGEILHQTSEHLLLIHRVENTKTQKNTKLQYLLEEKTDCIFLRAQYINAHHQRERRPIKTSVMRLQTHTNTSRWL